MIRLNNMYAAIERFTGMENNKSKASISLYNQRFGCDSKEIIRVRHSMMGGRMSMTE